MKAQNYSFSGRVTGPDGIARPSTGSFTITLPPLFGTNKLQWAEVSSALGQMNVYRAYNTPGTGIPADFPGRDADPVPSGVTVPAISIRPSISTVLTGSLDDELAAFFGKVPENAMITAWHEGEGARFGYTEAQIKGLAEHIYPIFKAHAPKSAMYGQCFMTYSSTKAGRGIQNFAVPGMDFYAFDGYGSVESDTAESVFGPALSQLNQVVHDPDIAVWEANHALKSSRPAWFEDVWQWSADNFALTMLPYWGTPPYIWDSSDTATINALKNINSGS